MNMEEVKVTSTVDEEGALSITMEGKNMGILIGKRGQTLDSLQYLTSLVVNKEQQDYVRGESRHRKLQKTAEKTRWKTWQRTLLSKCVKQESR